MKKVVRITVILVIISLIASYYNNSSIRQIISHTVWRGRIKNGILKYQVSFLGIFTVGEAVFALPQEDNYAGRAAYLFKADARTLPPFSRVFPAQISVESLIGKGDGYNPMLFRQKLKISGKPDSEKEIFYDQQKHIMNISGVERVIFPDTQDPLSLIFRLEQMDFSKNKEIALNINTNQKNYIVTGRVKEWEIYLLGRKKTLFTLDAEIKRQDKNPYHKSYIQVVFAKEDGQENIPLLIRVFAGGALVNVKLVYYEKK